MGFCYSHHVATSAVTMPDHLGMNAEVVSSSASADIASSPQTLSAVSFGFVDHMTSPELKVVIYNWRGMPNRQTMLQELLVMIKAAEKVMAGDRDAEPTFGDLIILMRDVGDAAGIEKIVLGEERTRGLKYKEKKDMDERNVIRRGLKEAFRSISIHVMPSPHRAIEGGWVFADAGSY